MSAASRLRQRFTPRALPHKEYLGQSAFLGAIGDLIGSLFVAAYAVSRTTGHRVSPTATAAILIGAAALYAPVSAITGFFSGLSDTFAGLVLKDGTEKPSPAGDPFSPRELWGRGLIVAAASAVWSVGLALLVVAALNHRQAGFWAIFVGLVGTSTVTAVVSGLASTEIGIRTGFDRPKTSSPRPARRRAWLELALPVATVLAITSAAFGWLLFHDYAVHSQFAVRSLTEKEVLGDLFLEVFLITAISVFVLRRAGRAEATLGLVAFEDRDTQIPGAKSLFGPQAFVYVGLVTIFVIGALVKFILPELPNLAEALIARGFIAFVTAFLAGGIAYMQGAANATAAPVMATTEKAAA